MKTWLPLIPGLKFRLFCCLWNSSGCLDVSGQVFPILNLFVWKRAQIRGLSLSQALVLLFQCLKFWLERTDFWEIKAQSPSPSLSAGTLWQIQIRSWTSSPVSTPCLGGSWVCFSSTVLLSLGPPLWEGKVSIYTLSTLWITMLDAVSCFLVFSSLKSKGFLQNAILLKLSCFKSCKDYRL